LLLQRLAVFSGGFSLEGANAVTSRGEASDVEIIDGVANLVSKSMVTSDITGRAAFFRLLETTRVYALSKLTQGGELQELSRRHALYYQRLLERTTNEQGKRSTPLAHVDNIRAALEWCFGVNGNFALGVGLAAAAAPAFLAMSLLPECHRWSARAIRALEDTARGGFEEMHLQASLGVSSMQIHGQSDAARVALNRSLEIAEARGDVLNQVGLLGMLSMFYVRDGDFKTSLHYAKLSRGVDGIMQNSAAMALANSILGRALQFVGDHGRSRTELEASFRYWSSAQQAYEVYLGLDHDILVGIGLARNLWLQGRPTQAAERVRRTIKDAERKNHPASLGLALSWAPGVFLWIGDLGDAEEHTNWLMSHAESHSLRPYFAVARAYRGALAIARDDPKGGVENLQDCLEQLHAMRYEMLNTGFKLCLVQGFMAMGQFGEALTLIDETIALVEANGDFLHMPEALRVKGSVLLSMPQPRAHEAEMYFVQSLEWSRQQGARSWELRTANDLASLWIAQGEHERAQAVLQPIFETFVEGLGTADLKVAGHLLATLR
jgi:tetratricopeptide (TPR) repeat protein